jgi:hypothetical protein
MNEGEGRKTKIRKKVPEGGSLSNEERLVFAWGRDAKTCKKLQTGRGEISKSEFYRRRGREFMVLRFGCVLWCLR